MKVYVTERNTGWQKKACVEIVSGQSHMKVYVLATRMKPNSLVLPSNQIQMEW